MSSKQIGIGLYEFLIESELQHYYNSIKNDLKVLSVCQLKYVTDEDLVQIGMSRPEIRRLKKFFLKYCPQTYLAKIKKKLLNRRDDAISVAALSSYAQNVPGRPVRNVAPGRHIIQADSIVIHKTLGSGEFGTVQQGVWTSEDGQRTQVAIKCLSQERMENNPVEFLKEAAIMHNVDHEHVVRLYGVVLDTSALMLVTELAPLRSLLECLKEPSMRPNLSVPTLYDFAVQICDGMQYLESKRLIHRDLAARNILVFSRTKVKISDFGLSRALGVGKDYYQTNFNVNLKLPIAWCAPECINFLRFTTASDVWAYGVALWEMFSYGFQPWAALTGQQILEAIDEPNYQRLERPECCPNEIYYQIMLKCWQHDPQSRPTFTQLSNLILESKPEMVQAIRESDARPRRDFLVYDAGDLITVLDKKPSQNTDDVILWKGALKDGKTGLFHPASTITYIGSSLPSVKNSQGSFHRNDSRSSSMRKGRISADMISGPQGDLKHTGHVGPDGQFFGDLTFLGSKCWVPRQVVSPYKPESPTSFDASGSTPSLPGPQCSSRSVKESTSDMSSSDTVPLLETASSMNTDDVGNRSSSSTGVLRRRHHMALSTVGNNFGEQDHEYHEISDEENDNIGAGISGCYHLSSVGLSNPALSSRSQSPLDSPRFEKNFDLEVGPSLIDEVFSALQHDCHSQPDEAHNVKNELREMARAKKKFASVKPISSSDRRTLDHAIAIANELASRSMLDLDRSGKHRNSSMDDISSPQTPNSPSHRRKFSFILGGKNDRERRNYSQEAASIPDIQSTLTEEAKEAYNSLVEKPSNTLEFLTPSYDSRTTFVFPENNNSETRSSTSNVFDTETTSSAAGPQSLTESFINLKSSASANVNITSFPGKNHARSLSKSDADEEPVTSYRILCTKDDDEVDGNPLRLLRQNKQAMLTNVLPLPPRKGATSQSTQSTRHQRKHPLLIPNRVNSSIPRECLQTTAAREAPTPPPKPARQAISTTMTTETGDKPEEPKTNLTSCLNSELEKKSNGKVVGSETIERDMIKFPDCQDNTTVGITNRGVSSEPSRRSEEPISLYENIIDAAADNARVTDANGNEADDGSEIMPKGQEPPQPATSTISSTHDTTRLNEGLSRVQSLNPKPQESSPAPKPFQESSNNNIKIKPESSPYALQVAQPFRIAPGSSIKIKTLQRILGPSATEKDCCWALEATDMDSAHAVKLLRLKALLPESLISEDVAHVVSVLEMSHWDVARSAAFLLNTSNGSTSKTVPSRSKLSGLADLSAPDQSSAADSLSSVDVAVTNRKSFQPDSPGHPYIRPTQV